jgi:hypothetical protein
LGDPDSVSPAQFEAAQAVAPCVCPRLTAVAVQRVDPYSQLTSQQIEERLAALRQEQGMLIESRAEPWAESESAAEDGQECQHQGRMTIAKQHHLVRRDGNDVSGAHAPVNLGSAEE